METEPYPVDSFLHDVHAFYELAAEHPIADLQNHLDSLLVQRYGDRAIGRWRSEFVIDVMNYLNRHIRIFDEEDTIVGKDGSLISDQLLLAAFRVFAVQPREVAIAVPPEKILELYREQRRVNTP